MSPKPDNHAPLTPAVELPRRWSILAFLGSGGQAEVWLVEDHDLGRRVALKILRPDATSTVRARWVRELRLGMQIDHPHIVRTLDVVELEQDLIAVLEYMSAGSLGKLLSFRGPCPVEKVAMWARQGMDALAFLHDQKIVHRDIKPSNLLLTDDGGVKLSDLGLAGELESRRAADQAPLGTHTHMPAEQRSGKPPEPWWDLHALGVTLYQSLTGELPPRDDEGCADLVASRLGEPVGRLHWMAELIDRLLEHRPALRWSDARSALAAFETLPGA
jgi:serine/threonine-protein kinase